MGHWVLKKNSFHHQIYIIILMCLIIVLLDIINFIG